MNKPLLRRILSISALLISLILPSYFVQAQTAITIGETSVLTSNDSGNGNLLIAQQATLSQTATIQSLSFYVTTASGDLRLGIYDATGPNGGPGAKKEDPGRQPLWPARAGAKDLRERPGGRLPHRRGLPGGAAGLYGAPRSISCLPGEGVKISTVSAAPQETVWWPVWARRRLWDAGHRSS